MLLVVGYMPSTLLVKSGNGVYGAVITAKPYTIVVIFSVHSVLPNLSLRHSTSASTACWLSDARCFCRITQPEIWYLFYCPTDSSL